MLVERERHYIRSEAILRIGRLLNGPLPLPLLAAAGFPVPLPFRDAFYDQVANNRCVQRAVSCVRYAMAGAGAGAGEDRQQVLCGRCDSPDVLSQ